jgi:hypothetical protein
LETGEVSDTCCNGNEFVEKEDDSEESEDPITCFGFLNDDENIE